VVKLGWIGLERKKQQTKVCCFTDWWSKHHLWSMSFVSALNA
jgi:hypothetical protein